MRLSIGLFFIFICSQTLGQVSPPYPLWKVYRIQKGDWIYKLSRDLENKNIVVISTKDLAERILKRNPQIKNPRNIKPGDEILIPYSQNIKSLNFKENLSSSDKQVIYNNHYYNAVIYQGAIPTNLVNAKVIDQETRKVASYSPPSVQNVNKNIVRKKTRTSREQPISISVEPFFQFSKLDATEEASQRTAQLVSETNTGVSLGLRHGLRGDFDLLYFASYTEEIFARPTSNLSTTNLEQNYLQFGIAVPWRFRPRLQITPFLSYRERAYIQIDTVGINVSKASHPLVGLDFSYELINLKKVTFSALTHLAYFFPGTNGNLKVKSGFAYGGGLSIGTDLWKQNFVANIWLRSLESQTEITKQNSLDMTMSILWQTHF